MDIVFATNNNNKIIEIQSFVDNKLNIIGLREIGITEEIEEPYQTFRENAWAKAIYVYNKTAQPCFAEDSGLVVPALDGAPGVLSARYAGEHGNDTLNNSKLIADLELIKDRKAYYKAVICLIIDAKQVFYFEGVCWGQIAMEPKGDSGFGYDPLFIPDGHDHTFAELGMPVKKQMSHRSEAVNKLLQFLNAKY